jgi:ribosome-binding factor A
MVDEARARRLAGRIHEIVAGMLEHGIKDPRLGMVTVTGARVTGDLREATIFYTVLGGDDDRAATAAALDSARGVLRTEVGRRTGVKFTPTLAFVLDRLPEDARHIDELVAVARAADEELARSARAAQPAGDPHPYRDSGQAGGSGNGQGPEDPEYPAGQLDVDDETDEATG